MIAFWFWMLVFLVLYCCPPGLVLLIVESIIQNYFQIEETVVVVVVVIVWFLILSKNNISYFLWHVCVLLLHNGLFNLETEGWLGKYALAFFFPPFIVKRKQKMPDLVLLSVKITIAAPTCSCSEWRRYEVYQLRANLERLHKTRKKWSYPLKPNHPCLDHTSPQNSSNCDHHTHWWHKCNDLLSQHMPHHADCSLMLHTSIHFLQDHNIPQCCSMKKKIVWDPCIM